MITPMRRFLVSIEAPHWTDVQDVELPDAPREGDTIETRYGTCLVTKVELDADGSGHAGKIVCRFP